MKGRIEKLVIKAEEKGKKALREANTPNPYVQEFLDKCDEIIEKIKNMPKR